SQYFMIFEAPRDSSRRFSRGNVIAFPPEDVRLNHVFVERDLIVSRDSRWSAMLPHRKNAWRWHDFPVVSPKARSCTVARRCPLLCQNRTPVKASANVRGKAPDGGFMMGPASRQ